MMSMMIDNDHGDNDCDGDNEFEPNDDNNDNDDDDDDDDGDDKGDDGDEKEEEAMMINIEMRKYMSDYWQFFFK